MAAHVGGFTHFLSTDGPRVVIYARYSTHLQRDVSIEDQVRECRTLADRNRWSVRNVYSDHAITGSELEKREGYIALLAALRRGEIDIIIAESLDRLSRHRVDLPYLCELCASLGVKIVTLIENEVNDITSAVKGLTNVLFFKDLAAKTRRGLRGRVAAGASAGGLSYGYDVVPAPEGEDRGGLIINAEQSAVIIRIFNLYGADVSPKKIADMLNAEKVPGPRGKHWSQSTINGNRKRGTGILNNELYIGVRVWNRLSYFKDPDTRHRRSRANPPEEHVREDVPELRILDQERWEAVRARQAKLDAKATPASDGSTFQSQQRGTHLLAKLLKCGRCGGGYSKISKTHLGCSNARNKGAAVCKNRRTIKRTELESAVLDALRTRLMSPELYASFVRGFTAEWNKEQGARATENDKRRDELKRVEKKISNLVGAIAESGSSVALLSGLKEAEARKAVLEAELAVAKAPAPRLMPNLADLYRAKVAALQELLEDEDAGAAREQIRALIDEVRLIPRPSEPKAPLGIEVRGALAAMLTLASGMEASSAVALEKQFKLVAGAGFEPAAFRL